MPIIVTTVGQHLSLKVGFACLYFKQVFLGKALAKIIDP